MSRSTSPIARHAGRGSARSASAAPASPAIPAPTRSRRRTADSRPSPPRPRAWRALEVFPAEINLTTARDRQSIVVQATYADGITRDVTARGRRSRRPTPRSLKRDGADLLPGGRRRDDAGGRVRRPDASRCRSRSPRPRSSPPLSFRLDVMPVFMRAGCNTGSCHGAARGKDGFRISLFGFDPEGDHYRLTREMVGRRINLAVPADSTLLEKATGAVPHTGGKRFEPASELYQTLHQLDRGRRPERRRRPSCPRSSASTSIPRHGVLDGKGATQQMTVRARYSDGTDRDVTSLAVFLTNNEGSAAVNARRPRHRRRARRGVRHGPVRDLHRRLAVHRAAQGPEVRVPAGARGQLHRQAGRRQAQEAADRPLGRLRRRDLPAPGLPRHRRPAADRRGVRPVHGLDRPGQAGEAGRRAARAQGVLRDLGDQVGRAAADPLDHHGQLQGDVPLLQLAGRASSPRTCRWTRWCRSCSAPAAARSRTPATNFYQTTTETLPADRERRPGVHGHADPVRPVPQPPVRPLDAERLLRLRRVLRPDRPQAGRGLPRDDRLQLGRRRGDAPGRRPGDDAEVPGRRGARRRRARTAASSWRSGSPRRRIPGSRPRSPTASGPTSWASGIVEPVDDVRVSNPASNPELLEALGKHFTDTKYDLKALVRDICNSRTYQRTTQRNESNASDERNFAHALVRRIKAENLLDTISAVTEHEGQVPGPAARRPGRADRRRPRARPTSSPPSAGPPARRSARAR